MNPTIDRQVGIESPGHAPTPDHSAPVQTATAAMGAPEAPIGLDPTPEGEPVTRTAGNDKPMATPGQAMLLEDHIEAVRAMQATGFVRGRAIDEFLATGVATGISEAQAKRIIDNLKLAPEPETSDLDHDEPAAPVVGGEPVTPAATPELDPEAEEEVRREENNWAGQPASDGMKKEMDRVMGLRGEAVSAVVASWQQAGIEVKMPTSQTVEATKGDFKDLKAADQASNIAANAAKRVMEWESIRANKDGIPYDPAQTVGQYVTEKVKAKLDELTLVAPAVKDAILGDKAVMALVVAGLAKNRNILENYQKAPEAAQAYKPSRFDYAPNIGRALQFALAAHPGMEPEGIRQAVKMAYSAGTVGMLYRLSDALGLKDVAKVKVKEAQPREPRNAGQTGPKDPDWASKPIDKRDAEKLAGAIAAKGFDVLPDWAKQRLGGDITKVGSLSQGDFAKLRKAGVVENAQTGTSGRKPFDPSEAASPKTVEKVKASTTALDKVGADLAEKVTKIRAGEAIALTKGEVADLRKAKVIE